MKKITILAIAFALGTTTLVASAFSNTNHFLPIPPTQNNTTETKTTSIKNEMLKEEIIVTSLKVEKNIADLNFLKQQKKLKLAQAIRAYKDIAPEIIDKE